MKWAMPVLLMAMLFYVSSHLGEIKNNYKTLGSNVFSWVSGKEPTLSSHENSLKYFNITQDSFLSGKNKENMFNIEKVRESLTSTGELSIIQESGRKLVGGVWVPSEDKSEAVEFTLSTKNALVALYDLDNTDLYYEYTNANIKESTITTLVRLREVK